MWRQDEALGPQTTTVLCSQMTFNVALMMWTAVHMHKRRPDSREVGVGAEAALGAWREVGYAGARAREVAEGLIEVDDNLRKGDRAEVAGSATSGAELDHVLRQAERQDRPLAAKPSGNAGQSPILVLWITVERIVEALRTGG